jgi:hypothetical protein
MRTRRLGLVWFLQNRILLNRAMWLGAVAASAMYALAPAIAQGPPGAAAAAAGAAAEATAAAPRPAAKKTAASAAAEAGEEGNSAVAAHLTQTATPHARTATPPRNTEEAANGVALTDNAVTAEKSAPAPILTGVAAQCADLLKLATSLKAEVGKTTKDELSVPVVRDAGQIEHLAHKIRDQQR